MRLLVIEDNRALCAALRPLLTGDGWTVDFCHDGADGLALLRSGGYDVCVLDRMLPGLDGLGVLRAARAAGIATPVLLLTALARVGDKIDGLDAGADDYLAKPFDTGELLARLRALARRHSGGAGPLRAGDLVLDTADLTLRGPATEVMLSPRECALLECFLQKPGQLHARAALLARVWGPLAEVEDGNLDCYIHFIRRRLRQVGSVAAILTVRGAGYRLEVAP